MHKRTKIVCTIGPASETVPVLKRLLKAGMNVARLNFSHGTYKHHRMLIANIRRASKETGIPVSILQDLQGPRIRIGTLPKEGVVIQQGERVILTSEIHPRPPFVKEGEGGFKILPQQYRGLARDVRRGTPILIADGAMRLLVESVRGNAIRCRVVTGGVVQSHKGLNVPGVSLGAKPITKKDVDDLAFGLKQGVDFVTLSFVKDAGDIIVLQKLMRKLQGCPLSYKGHPCPLPKTVAKVERPEAVKHIRRIAEVADAVMIGRGDLALEANQTRLTIMQKDIIAACRAAETPVIVATQMLESMMVNPRPTRAEIADITNAVIDHTDATMLSGETAGGKYPAEACSMMAQIIRQTERSRYDNLPLEAMRDAHESPATAFAFLAQQIRPRFALVAPRAVAAYLPAIVRQRPETTIVPLVKTLEEARRLFLFWGVYPLVVNTKKPRWPLLSSQLRKYFSAKKGDTTLLFDDTTEKVFGGEQIHVETIA